MIITRAIRYIARKLRDARYRQTMRHYGAGANIVKPLKINYPRNISIGEGTVIETGAWLAANPCAGSKTAELVIGKGCQIGHFNELYATQSIVLEDYVLTADRVYISDNLHGYEDPEIPVLRQPIRQIRPVRIGEGSWLGVGVAVMGATIGKHCVIGANAVVNRDIPDYSIAVGIPAKVIKRYNHNSRRWEKTNPDGSFITASENTTNKENK